MGENLKMQDVKENQEETVPDSKPIEPQNIILSKLNAVKVVLFLIFICYLLISNFRVPILIRLGQFLIVEHVAHESDLIVCMAGDNIERGLTVADIYKNRLASKIFIAREALPDGFMLLEQRGYDYPETIDLLKKLLHQTGIPESAIITSTVTTDSTMDEALLVKELVEEMGIKSMIVVTSPTHTRRTWLTFRKILNDNDIQIQMIPAEYSDFRPDTWWKNRKYLRTVIIEYQKLIYYWFKLIT